MSLLAKKNALIIAISVLLVGSMVTGTVFLVKGKQKKIEETTTAVTSTTEETTWAPAFTVDLDYINKMLKEKRFTDEFETYTKSSFPVSTQASKEAYWRGIQKETVVNPLLLSATSEYLHTLEFDTPNVRPTDLYYESEGKGYLSETGEEVLSSVHDIIFSDQTLVYTDDLGKNASKYYNSSSSAKDGIVYAEKVGIKGNTACFVIKIQTVTDAEDIDDVDSAFDDIIDNRGKDDKKSNDSESVKTVVQLCRCGNTVDKTPKKITPEPTTKRPTTKPSTTKEPTTKPSTSKEPTTKPSTTKEPTTKPSTTKKPTTKPSTTLPKNPASDPAEQSNAPRGGGKNDPTEKATSAVQPDKPTKATTVRVVETTTRREETTTKPTTTKRETTTRPVSTTKPTTTAPKAEPTQKPSSGYTDDKGNTTVITPSEIFSGRPVLPD